VAAWFFGEFLWIFSFLFPFFVLIPCLLFVSLIRVSNLLLLFGCVICFFIYLCVLSCCTFFVARVGSPALAFNLQPRFYVSF
jgi:hypothetical protein